MNNIIKLQGVAMLPKRQLICNVDGDGCWNIKWVKAILKLILKYPTIKFDVSAIICYFDGTIRREDKQLRSLLFRTIFDLPNVEVCSHSYSHPTDWKNQQSMTLLPKMQSVWNPVKEILYSTDYIEYYLSKKKCKVFLLTGYCNPNEEIINMIYSRGMYAFNGNMQSNVPFEMVGGYPHFFQRSWHDLYFFGKRGERKVRNTTTRFRPFPEGYKHVIDYWMENPDRPVHVYFHFYSAEFGKTLESLDYVLDWCSRQDLEPLFLSEYAKNLS